MSILTFLFFASVIYFASAAESVDAPATLVSSSDQLRVNSFMTKMEKLYDDDLAEAFAKMDQKNVDYLKAVFLDGIGGFVNYMFYQKQQYNQTADSQVEDDDDIIIQFKALDPYIPAVPYQQPPAPAPCQSKAANDEDLTKTYSKAAEE